MNQEPQFVSRTDDPGRDARRSLSSPVPQPIRGYGYGIATPTSRPLAFMVNNAGDGVGSLAAPVRATTRPAGDVTASLTAGVPASQYGIGMFEFATNVLVLGADPTVDRGAFAAQLAASIRSRIASAIADPRYISIEKGAQTTLSVPRTLLGVTVPGASREVRGWWIRVSGFVLTAGPWQLAWLNNAIATTLANVTSFRGYVDEEFRAKLGAANAQGLFARLSAADACSGGADLTAVYARACTRVVPGTRFADGVFPGMGVMTPIAPPPTSATPTPAATSPDAPACTVQVASKFWLRPRATFNREGSEYPVGTAVEILGRVEPVQRQGSLTLYRVRVGGTPGFAAFDARDVATCTTLAATATSGGGGSSGGGSRPATSSTPTISTTRQETSGTGDGTFLNPTVAVDEGSSPWPYVAGAAALAGLGGVLYWKRDDIRAAWQKNKQKRNANLPATRQR